MMKNRPYIRCPLEAALAAKNHGFNFFVYNGSGDIVMPITFKTPEQLREGLYAWVYDDGETFKGTGEYGKIYISDESLPLLQPMVGDLVHEPDKNHSGYVYWVRPDSTVSITGHFIAKTHAEELLAGREIIIIQRNNLPFPKIEVDDE